MYLNFLIFILIGTIFANPQSSNEEVTEKYQRNTRSYAYPPSGIAVPSFAELRHDESK
jgi:hypothetical protein